MRASLAIESYKLSYVRNTLLLELSMDGVPVGTCRCVPGAWGCSPQSGGTRRIIQVRERKAGRNSLCRTLGKSESIHQLLETRFGSDGVIKLRYSYP